MTKTRLRLTVLALFIDNNEVLMIHQMTFPEPDCWDLPGGGIEPHESLIEALRREVQEETSITDFKIEKLLTVAESFFPETEGKILHTVNIIYHCSVSPKPHNLSSDETEVGPKGIQWIPINQLTPELCSSRSWQALEILNQNIS